jgi:predicted DNA-binding protein (MmcQ/YjbR family)
MTRDDFDLFCGALPATTHVVQWGNASVWKVGGKIFAVCSSWGEGAHAKISFKCSDLSYALLTQQDGLIPAPYLARAKWVQMEKQGALSAEDLKAYIVAAHKIVAAKLTKKQQKDLGLAG